MILTNKLLIPLSTRPTHVEPEAPAGRKDDAGKDDWWLLPTKALRSVVRVLMHGAKLYAPGNWRLVPDARKRYYSAALRHLFSWHEGERTDANSGLPSLAHACCCILFLLALELEGAL